MRLGLGLTAARPGVCSRCRTPAGQYTRDNTFDAGMFLLHDTRTQTVDDGSRRFHGAIPR